MAKNIVESSIRFPVELHTELSLFLVQLKTAKGKKISIQEYTIEAIKEKMESDRKEYSIKKVEL